MALYYFDCFVDGVLSLQGDEAVTLPDIEAAKVEAVRATYAIAGDLAPEVRAHLVTISVRGVSQEVLFETELRLNVRSGPKTSAPSQCGHTRR